MVRYDRRIRLLAICLSALAGYVDALGFLASGGFFTSFMSGNSTRLGVGVSGDAGSALMAGGLIAAFVLGVIGGTLLGMRFPKARQTAILLTIAGLLAIAALLHGNGWLYVALAATAFAMGAENTLFEAEGEVRIGLTYMTGTLVKLGQRLTAAMTGGERWSWLPYLGLWIGLVAGAIAGAAVYPLIGLSALWAAVAAAALLAFMLRR